MTISLRHARSILRGQSPKEYVSQLAVTSHAQRQAKLASRGGAGAATTGSELEQFREIMEPPVSGA